MKLTMFFDSYCPLCVAEVRQLESLNHNRELEFVDIHNQDFALRFPHIDPQAADRVLHAQYADGRLIYGLDVSAEVWAMVGKHRWLRVLRWPVLRWFSDLGYKVFARYRYGISYILTGQRRCEPCNRAGSPDSKHCRL